MSDPASPCIAICELDASQHFCSGCGRSTDEIAQWRCADAEQKQIILDAARQRLADQT